MIVISILKKILSHITINIIRKIEISLKDGIEDLIQTDKFYLFVNKQILKITNHILQKITEKIKEKIIVPVEISKEEKEIKEEIKVPDKEIKASDKEINDAIDDKINIVTGQIKHIVDNIVNFNNKNKKGGVNTTKYIINPEIPFPSITPDLVSNYSKNLYKPLEPFLSTMSCDDCNNNMIVKIKKKIINKLLDFIDNLINLIIPKIIENTHLYKSFIKTLSIIKNEHCIKGQKISKIIEIFENQIIENNNLLEKINKEENTNKDDLSQEELYKKEQENIFKNRKIIIDETIIMLKELLKEIKNDKLLPSEQRDPENIIKRRNIMLNIIKQKIEKIKSTIKNDIVDKTHEKAEKENENFINDAKIIFKDLNNLREMQPYDETLDNENDKQNPETIINNLIQEVNALLVGEKSS